MRTSWNVLLEDPRIRSSEIAGAGKQRERLLNRLERVVPPRGLERMECTDEQEESKQAHWLLLVRKASCHRWDDRTAAMRQLRKAGVTLTDIGEQFGLTAERVRQILSSDVGPSNHEV